MRSGPEQLLSPKRVILTRLTITTMAHVSYSVAASCHWPLDWFKRLKAGVSIKDEARTSDALGKF